MCRCLLFVVAAVAVVTHFYPINVLLCFVYVVVVVVVVFLAPAYVTTIALS